MIPRIDKFAYSFAVTLFCLLFSLYVYYPGWMSPDSFAQYEDARAGLYHDWHPVFMAWWWRLLLNVWEGPQPILLQNLLFYWGGWFLLACWAGRRIGRAAVIVPFIGLWPGLSFPLGQIWKDIFFATPLFFSWALLFYVGDRRDYPSWFHRILLAFSLIIGVGAKPNGIVVLPFILAHWALLECRGWRITFTQLVVPTVGATILVSAVPIGISSMLPVQHSYPFQYTQTYDLLAISVATEKNLLPSYLKMKFGGGIDDVRGLYFVGGNNLMFYNKVGSINTSNENDLLELRHHWIDAIAKHPGVYLRHRLLNFLSLLRFGETAPAVVADPGIMENSYGLRARWTFIGSLLTTSLAVVPWVYFPWIYAVLLAISLGALFFLRNLRVVSVLVAGGALAFVAPHFFIAPASDYRYLYFAYLCSMMLAVMAVVEAVQKFLFTKKLSDAGNRL